MNYTVSLEGKNHRVGGLGGGGVVKRPGVVCLGGGGGNCSTGRHPLTEKMSPPPPYSRSVMHRHAEGGLGRKLAETCPGAGHNIVGNIGQ